ncbi:bifunctional glutamate N-acetyltransferase/amino-acid acetyltransferase ArgJ [Altererythrobacter aurantiacus]|uniref:Arginine biosynthesis bifunctional protein ArgJ n=1 Tax=Parapontixanthobacter aurantiacus TaxID=1463599 RepID=A0A844ZCX1_9SPHN|nr:bifunctional glutamate N-acetyltransferase/amino-acid acetyltransferase ArgJ [Parapontixanthobacter aurantiacus]MXO85122.1 bifunctional glutamate N-acetyltransferase/amino-acid acetyltransferase ArgJ [Parapontixanthobacter aurantiacus]
MDLTRSPLALPFPELPEIEGVTVRVARAQYKDWDRADLTFIELAEGTSVAGVFTKSACASSEVELGREQRERGKARALVVNAGNANAFTGYRGREAVEQIAKQVSDHLGCEPGEVFVSSTGVIGVPLPQDKARRGIAAVLDSAPVGWREATDAIATTDTFPKAARTSAMIGDARVELVGVVKGSGMIAPDMATMLGYVFTDAAISPALLQEMLERANEQTFSCITVDGDTSTSDTVLAFATGKAANPTITSQDDAGADAFAAALTDLCRKLAQLVVRDGEGAQKFITIDVVGAASDESARRIGLAIGNSPLVKTAIAGGDANWGRVVMAVGKAGEPADRDRLSIAFGGVWTARDGQPVEDYDERPVAEHLSGDAIDIRVELGIGQGHATVWTCDLTHGYIAINADYRS